MPQPYFLRSVAGSQANPKPHLRAASPSQGKPQPRLRSVSHSQVNQKPRLRGPVNQNFAQGKKNCQKGLYVKVNKLFRRYNVDIAIVIRMKHGEVGGYQSTPGLAQELIQSANCHLLLPQHVEEPSKIIPQPPKCSLCQSSSASSVAESDELFAQNLPENLAAVPRAANIRQSEERHYETTKEEIPIEVARRHGPASATGSDGMNSLMVDYLHGGAGDADGSSPRRSWLSTVVAS